MITYKMVKADIGYRVYRGGEKRDYMVAIFDEPGKWWDDEWNVHYDGCDHPCEDLEGCKAKLMELDGFKLNPKTWGYDRDDCTFCVCDLNDLNGLPNK